MDYILSIVIPTRNRFEYLRDCIQTLNNIHTAKMEVVVQDNSDDHTPISEFIKGLGNDNIKYYYRAGKLTQTENSELAITHATGEYVCYIGDDDSICEKIIDLAEAMKQFDIDACTYRIATYNWPDLVALKPELYYFKTPMHSGMIQARDPLQLLHKRLRRGIHEIYGLPRVYHGIVSRRLLDEIHRHLGCYFPGPSPDMANATACALYARNLLNIDIPMIVCGFGKNSAGGLGKRGLHKGTLKGNFQLRADIEEVWDSRIPKLWMGVTIWPESAISALTACNREDLISEINFEDIYAATILMAPADIRAVFKCIHSFKSFGRTLLHLLLYIIKKIIAGLLNMVSQANSSSGYYYNKMSLIDAVNKQNEANRNYDVALLFKGFFENSI